MPLSLFVLVTRFNTSQQVSGNNFQHARVRSNTPQQRRRKTTLNSQPCPRSQLHVLRTKIRARDLIRHNKQAPSTITTATYRRNGRSANTFQHVPTSSTTTQLFQHNTTRSNTFQHVPTRSNTFQHVPTRSNTFQHYMLQHDPTRPNTSTTS